MIAWLGGGCKEGKGVFLPSIAAKPVTPKPSSFKNCYFIIISHHSGDKLDSARCLELSDAHGLAVGWGWNYLKAHAHTRHLGRDGT